MRTDAIIRHIEKAGGRAGFSQSGYVTNYYLGTLGRNCRISWESWATNPYACGPVLLDNPEAACTTFAQLDRALRRAAREDS